MSAISTAQIQLLVLKSPQRYRGSVSRRSRIPPTNVEGLEDVWTDAPVYTKRHHCPSQFAAATVPAAQRGHFHFFPVTFCLILDLSLSHRWTPCFMGVFPWDLI